MHAYEAIISRRSIRRYEEREVPERVLERCVNAARLSPSAGNIQPLKFITITDNLEDIFECTSWAGYLEWKPEVEEMPRAYIAIIKEDEGWSLDVGFAAQSICITAVEEGLGTCVLGALDKEELEELLPIPEGYSLELLVALGYPAEEAETVEYKDSIEYYYNENNKLYIPKRTLEDVWIEY